LKHLVAVSEHCAGCKQCEMVCSFHHSGRFSPSFSRITVLKNDRYGLDYPIVCRQCDRCPPLENCPVNAMSRMNGIIKVDLELCIGCEKCVDLCKFGAVKVSEGKAIICDLCHGEPECVKRCPTHALNYIETESNQEMPGEAFNEQKKRWGMIE